ncbi:MAG: hypothetical protein ACJASM_002843 [Salibacteraceae bacterium]
MGEAILSDLYSFNENRILQIANSYKERMTDNELKNLAESLTNEVH